MNNGYVALHRKILDWEWFKDNNMFKLFVYLVLKANHEDQRWNGVVIKRGQLVTGRLKLSQETGISQRTLRTCINRLKSTSELSVKTTNKFSLITIVNYDLYQDNRPAKRPATRHSTDQQPTTNNNDNNVNKIIRENVVPPKGSTSESSNWKPEYGERYIQIFNKLFNSSARLTPNRLTKLKMRFKRFTGEEIAKALYHLSKSDFHRGKNDTGWKADPDFLIRSDEQVDKWLNNEGGD